MIGYTQEIYNKNEQRILIYTRLYRNKKLFSDSVMEPVYRTYENYGINVIKSKLRLMARKINV